MSVLPATHIEIVRPLAAPGRVRSILLDFDGTLSLLREGWQQVMVPMMVEVLRETPRCEDEQSVAQVAAAFVEELTGKQTIYQMIRLGEEVEKRGGVARDPLDYKREYLGRLSKRIRHRIADLESGRVSPDDFLVPGARAFLEGLVARGASLYLASGTDRADVLLEAGLLEAADDRVEVWVARVLGDVDNVDPLAGLGSGLLGRFGLGRLRRRGGRGGGATGAQQHAENHHQHDAKIQFFGTHL